MNLNDEGDYDLLIINNNRIKGFCKLRKLLNLSKIMQNNVFNNNNHNGMHKIVKQQRWKMTPKLCTKLKTFTIFVVIFIHAFSVTLAQHANQELSKQTNQNQSSFFVVTNPSEQPRNYSTEKRSPNDAGSSMPIMAADNPMLEQVTPGFAPPPSPSEITPMQSPPMNAQDFPDDSGFMPEVMNQPEDGIPFNEPGKRRQYIPPGAAFEFGRPALAPALPAGPPPPLPPAGTCPSGGPSLPVECDPKRPWPQCPPQSYCYATNTVDIGPYFCCPIWSTYGAAWRPATPFYNYAPPPPPNWPNAVRMADSYPLGLPRKSKKEPRIDQLADDPQQMKIQQVVSEWTNRQIESQTSTEQTPQQQQLQQQNGMTISSSSQMPQTEVN